MRAVSFVLLLFLSSSALADDQQKLLGNWKLVSLFMEEVQTKQRSNVLGEHPSGFIGFTPERFFAVLMADARLRERQKNKPAPTGRWLPILGNGGWRARSSSRKST
jgi:Lipocalin-like domain